MVSLFNSFSRIKKQKVMVVGDLMLDTYTIGKAKRISPEAPVAVLQVRHEEHRPGGAGNVALNLTSMGAEVVSIGRIGDDSPGVMLLKALRGEGIDTEGIVTESRYSTPVKNRIIADNQQIVRVDYEAPSPLPELLEQLVVEALPSILEGVRLIAVSDYGKGFVTRTLMLALVGMAKERKIPVIADPKGVDFTKYAGVDVIKPNFSELYAAANLPQDDPIEQAAKRVLETTKAKTLMVTRSEEGITLFEQEGGRHDFPVRIREVKDVTGAGDTVLAMLACAMANGLTILEAALLSNVAAGIAIEKFGCARVTLSDLARRLLSDDIGNKVFDEEHLFALQEALKGRRFALLAVSSREGVTTELFTAIRRLAKRDNWDLLVYVRDVEPDDRYLDVLASLHDVDYIIVKSAGLQHLCNLIKPEEAYLFEEQVCVRKELVLG